MGINNRGPGCELRRYAYGNSHHNAPPFDFAQCSKGESSLGRAEDTIKSRLMCAARSLNWRAFWILLIESAILRYTELRRPPMRLLQSSDLASRIGAEQAERLKAVAVPSFVIAWNSRSESARRNIAQDASVVSTNMNPIHDDFDDTPLMVGGEIDEMLDYEGNTLCLSLPRPCPPREVSHISAIVGTNRTGIRDIQRI